MRALAIACTDIRSARAGVTGFITGKISAEAESSFRTLT
ncbi:hypothetical protein FHS82_001688 [Pseudochelatococcus lubricantis]|uniref:Uncharacterized protein n=1 Tax=Pseudochelatococcus lubricantis TaxID=1538102 RepID=A0ABX0UYP4_9HYPH|nr:hypothetical protein [Pseudochelatococcus lubricantis]